MTATQIQYKPGSCNIGRAEIGLRRAVGLIGLLLCVVLEVAFVVFNVAAPWRLLVFGPAFLAALGFLQAAWGFCAKYGLAGEYNVGPEIGQTSRVELPEARRKDHRTAISILGLSLLAGGVAAVAAYFTAA